MLQRVFVGLLFAGGGIAAVVYARKIVEFTGTSATLERYLGGGGTYNGLRIFGTILALFSLLYAFGFLNAAISGIGNFFSGILGS
jgi:hypothetical protein